MSIWRWARFLPEVPDEAQITLGEGETPLVRSTRIGPATGIELYFKVESLNPTGSYKDRFAAVGVARMLAAGKRRCLSTSSGNTGSALAAYCARAGIECIVAAVETSSAEKLAQMAAHGARIYRVARFGLDAELSQRVFGLLGELARDENDETLISAFACSPEAMSGVQTISYELHEQAADLEHGLAHVFCPAGGGGLTLAVAEGFVKIKLAALLTGTPAVHCVQPAGNDTIAGPLRRGSTSAEAVSCTTKIGGLQVPSVLDGDRVIAACRASGGTGHVVSDEEVWDAQRRLALEEGISCEPAGATALAGALRAASDGTLPSGAVVACLVTGAGWKDRQSQARFSAPADHLIDTDELERLLRRGS